MDDGVIKVQNQAKPLSTEKLMLQYVLLVANQLQQGKRVGVKMKLNRSPRLTLASILSPLRSDETLTRVVPLFWIHIKTWPIEVN